MKRLLAPRRGALWADFPGRSPQRVDSTQFAPRIGLAYQLNNRTVIRAYGGLMYLPTTGSAGAYSTSSASVPLSDAANAGWHASDDGGRNYISTWQNPFPRESMLTSFSRDIETINLQSSADPGAAPFTRDLHMPREYAWSVSVQEQLPMNFLLEAGYSGNRGLGLLSPYVTSHFPANLLQPQYGDIMTKIIPSPNAGQTLENSITGANQQIGLLMYDMPYYGNLNLLGSNIGSSTFHALHLRAEKRMANGFSFLANYTFSRLLDNVGGPEFETTGSVNTRGQGAKRPQTVLPPSSTWGLSAFDQTHRLSFSYIFEVPLGRGRRWMANPDNLGAKVLDAVVGGWGVSGFTSFVSGKPISLEGSISNNVNNVIKVNQTYGSYTGSDRDLRNSTFSGDKSQVLISPADGVTSSTVRAFDGSKVTNAQFFVLGNVPAVDPNIRHPGFTQTDLSIMKDFLITESKKLQFRAELQNAFNIRGFGNYNSTIGDPNFGLIQSAGNNSTAAAGSRSINLLGTPQFAAPSADLTASIFVRITDALKPKEGSGRRRIFR